MDERLLHHIWQHRMWLPASLTTVDGQTIDVVDPGWPNTEAGPDFFNATIRIGQDQWVGNVEIHTRASDWYRHGHDDDPAYKSVILHAVGVSDATISRDGIHAIPQVELPGADMLADRLTALTDTPVDTLACAARLGEIAPVFVAEWTSALGVERLQAKVDRIEDYLNRNSRSWPQALYLLLARALGFGTNSDNFERLAAATPLRALMRHQQSTDDIEAMLMGQAGLLDVTPDSEAERSRVEKLACDYRFLAAKYGLSKPNINWKMSRMRPQNFPHRRIAYLAQLISDGFSPAYNIFTVTDAAGARSLFHTTLPPFWQNHYTFTTPAPHSPTALSRQSVDTLLINVVAPTLYCHADHYDNLLLRETSIDILHSLPPENNRLCRLFTAAGLKCPNAFMSQAFIQLRREYCEKRKCLYCRFGQRLMSAPVYNCKPPKSAPEHTLTNC